MPKRFSIYLLLVVSSCFVIGKTKAQSTTDSTSTIITQTDSTIALTDTTESMTADSLKTAVKKKFAFEPNPKKAGMYSAIIPGTGQLYNRQYWKIPVIYAGVAAAGYFFQFNMKNYHKYRQAYYARIDNDPNTTDTDSDTKKYTTDNLKTLQDEYRKFMDITVLLTAVGYTAQVIDAIAAAHLKNFDISRDISMRMQPIVQPGYIGMGLAVNFK